jgi:uncharacterized protein YjbI with pentapeptide repeats
MLNNRIVLSRSLLFTALFLHSSFAPACAFDAEQLMLLKSGIKTWNVFRTEKRDVPVDLSGAALKGMKLRGADFGNANLSGADLGNADLTGAVLSGANLDDAMASGSVLVRASLESASLDRVDMEGAALEGASMKGASLQGTILKKADCTGVDFSGADLRETNFREASLVSAVLTGADLRAAYLWRADMSRSVINGIRVSAATVLETGKYATLAWASTHGALFAEDVQKPARVAVKAQEENGAIFSSEAQVGSSPQEPSATAENPFRAKVRTTGNIWRKSGSENTAYDQALFRKLKSGSSGWNDLRKRRRDISVDFQHARFDGKNLSDADLTRANLRSASFRRADLSGADLRHADLSGCDLREAVLERADLGDADLSGANLWRANLSFARLNGAKVSAATVLDSGKKASPEWAVRYDALFVQ